MKPSRFCLIVFFCSIYAHQLDARKSIVINMYYDSTFQLRVGTPPQGYFNAYADIYVGEMLFVDQNCGERRSDCPRYCNDPAFFGAYCPLGCEVMSSSTQRIYCGVGSKFNKYKLNDSSTAEVVSPRQKWSHQSADYRKSEGVWVKDVITDALNVVGTLRFVDLYYTDIRFLSYAHDSILGLAPSSNGLVAQLYEQEQIDTQALTIIPSTISGWLIAGGKPNNSFCYEDQWSTHQTVDSLSWMLRAKKIQIGDQVYLNQLITLAPDEKIRIPTVLLQPLIDKRMLFEASYNNERMFSICNSTQLDVRIQIDEREIFVSSSRMIEKSAWETITGHCFTRFWSTPAGPYTNKISWTLGNFLADFCLFLDYENMNIGIGNVFSGTPSDLSNKLDY
ncbi:hypothetical protein M3Y96_00467500 [Aphelenchoides besseyi]|nr:hypothetical protein M3Y96_00467500 [Aphelenchoides besseyi]